jgi:hypothetical protein
MNEALFSQSLQHVKYSPSVISSNDMQVITHYSTQNNTISLLALILGIYVLLLLSLPRFTNRLIIPVFIIVSVCASLLLSFSHKRPDISLSSWSETDSGDAVIRYSALLQIDGKSSMETRLKLPRGVGLPLDLRSNLPVSFNYKTSQSADDDLYIHTKLLSHQQYLVTGVVKYTPQLNINIKDKRVIIHNVSATSSVPAVLNWNDKRYSLPALRPGEQWSPPQRHDNWQDNKVESLFRKVTTGNEAAILVQNLPNIFNPQGLITARQNWLIIRKANASNPV